MQPRVLVQYFSGTSFLSLRGTRFLAYTSEQAPQSPLVSLRGAEGDEAISVGAGDCHAEFTLSGGEILHLRLRMTRSEGLAMTQRNNYNRPEDIIVYIGVSSIYLN
jgi:hypothetical protein